MSEFELQALTALREHMVTLVMLIDQLVDMPRGSDAPESFDCTAGNHPTEGRIDASAMGHPRFQCAACGEVVEMGDA